MHRSCDPSCYRIQKRWSQTITQSTEAGLVYTPDELRATWLEAELEAVRPELIVCLGATAAQSLLGSGFKIAQSHGKDRERDTKVFLDDLRQVTNFLKR